MTFPSESNINPQWRAEDITVEWLSEVLGKHNDFRSSKISSFDMNRISEEFGFIREVWRIKLEYERRTSSTPTSVVAKFANHDPHLRSLLASFSVREANVYRHLGSDSEFVMPRCYFSDSDSETGDCAILMEDLGRGRIGNNIGGISEQDAEAVVKAIAVFHAKWWGKTDKEQAIWLPSPIDRATIQSERFMLSVPIFLEKYGEQVDDEFREAVSLCGEKLVLILEAASSPPLTLIHGDLRPDNIVFDTEFRNSPVTMIDWPSTARTKGATDISCLAVHGLTVKQRRTIEGRLVHLYHTSLVSEGVTGYSIGQCQADYRSGFLYPFIIIVMILAYLDLNDERDKNIAHTQLKRMSAALRDHDLVELLQAM